MLDNLPIKDFVIPVSTVNPAALGDGRFNYIDIGSIDRDSKSISSVSEIDNCEAPSRARQLVKKGDILVSTVRPNLNAVAIVPDELDGAVASTGFTVLRPNSSSIHPRYLFNWVKSPAFVSKMVKVATGANYPAVSDRAVKASEIPAPAAVSEQERIAEVLDRADALRQKRRLAIQKLDALLRSVFLEMFGDPTTNPMGWQQFRLGSVSDVGSSTRVFVDELAESGIPFYRGTEIGRLGDSQSVDPSLFITKEHYERLKAQSGVPTRGDLLLPSICPDGRIYLVKDDQPFYFKDGRVLWIKVDQSRINSLFLRHYLKQLFFANYSKIASGTTFAELKIFALKELAIHVPPLSIQNRFDQVICCVDRLRVRLESQGMVADAFFSSLQRRAFNGELFQEDK